MKWKITRANYETTTFDDIIQHSCIRHATVTLTIESKIKTRNKRRRLNIKIPQRKKNKTKRSNFGPWGSTYKNPNRKHGKWTEQSKDPKIKYVIDEQGSLRHIFVTRMLIKNLNWLKTIISYRLYFQILFQQF